MTLSATVHFWGATIMDSQFTIIAEKWTHRSLLDLQSCYFILFYFGWGRGWVVVLMKRCLLKIANFSFNPSLIGIAYVNHFSSIMFRTASIVRSSISQSFFTTSSYVCMSYHSFSCSDFELLLLPISGSVHFLLYSRCT